MNASDFRIGFFSPLWLLALIPLVGLSLFFYFRIPKKIRKTKSHIISLVLHMIALCLCVLAAAGLNFASKSNSEQYDLVFVIDASDSCTSANEQINKYLSYVLSDSNIKNCDVSIVTYAKDQVTAVEKSNDYKKAFEEYVAAEKNIDISATNISAALEYAADLLNDPKNGRLILLSDGKQTDGDAALTAMKLADKGVIVDTVYFSSDNTQSEVQINSLRVKPELYQNHLTDVILTLRSSFSKQATLTLYDNGAVVEEQEVTLSGGTDTFSFIYFFPKDGIHELKAMVSCDGDTKAQNNSYYSYVKVLPRVSVLIIDGTGSDTDLLTALLMSDYDYDVVSSKQVPTSLKELEIYDEIIMLNVDMADLPVGYDLIVERYVEQGGGLFTVGGRNTYLLGNMENTRMENLLPVQLRDNDSPSLEIIIVMDISSSMSVQMRDSDKKRIDVAKEGAIASVNALRDRDYVGVVTFDANAYDFIPIMPATSRDEIISYIRDIEVGYGTMYEKALTMAQNRLLSSETDAVFQHIIFITDGNPSDRNYLNIIESMSQRGITLSTVAICQDDGSDTTQALINRVRQMAMVGNGRCYITSDANEFPEIMKTETLLSPKKLIIEGSTYNPERNGYSEVSAGVTGLPTLSGYVVLKKKEGVEVAFTVNNSPLFAQWKYGKGTVGSLMCDLGGEFAPNMLTEEDGVTFVNNAVSFLKRKKQSPDVVFSADNLNVSMFYRTAMLSGHSVTADITGPDGNVQTALLNISGTDGYKGTFATTAPGIYSILLTEKDGDGKAVQTEQIYTSFSYSKEYDVFSNNDDAKDTLNEICESTKGSMLNNSALLRDVTKEPIMIVTDPAIFLLIAMMVLFLADIAVRKFYFTR